MILTLLALFILVLAIVCLLIHHLKGTYMDGWETAAILLFVVSGAFLLICTVLISTKEIRASAEIVKIEAVRETFESARIDGNIHALELAAIQHKVAEKNEWIANAQFWTVQPLTNWFWSKRILEIKPIK